MFDVWNKNGKEIIIIIGTIFRNEKIKVRPKKRNLGPGDVIARKFSDSNLFSHTTKVHTS